MDSESLWLKPETTLVEWMQRCRLGQHSHHEAGKIYRFAAYCISIPSIVIPAMMGAIALLFVNSPAPANFQVLFGVLSVLAAVLSTLQTTLKLSELADRHTRSGAQYGMVRREIEELVALEARARPKPEECLKGLRAKLDHLGQETPVVPTIIWNLTIMKLKRKSNSDV